MTPLPLFQFRGNTIDPDRDGPRLGAQLAAVRQYALSGEWFTLSEVSAALGYPEASVSARLRDLRSLGYIVEREFVVRGLWRYRVKEAGK